MLSLKSICRRFNRRDERTRIMSRAAATVCEQLEGRQLLNAYMYNAVESAETITMMYEGGYLKIRASNSTPILYLDATSLVINGNARNNVIRIDSSVTIPVIVKGGAGNDLIIGGGGNNLLLGEDGNDTLVAGGGNDTLSGGAGIDTADFSGFSEGVDITIDGEPNDIIGSRTANWFKDDIEVWIGSKGDDLIDASGLNTSVTIKGGDGNDLLFGGDGNDVIDGGSGINSLNGGEGKDVITGWGQGKWTVSKQGAKAWQLANVYVDGGVLIVTGTSLDDKIVISSVDLDWYVVNINKTKWRFLREGIETVAVYGGPGNDRISFVEGGSPFTAKMVAKGGPGRNTIVKPQPKIDAGGDDGTGSGSDGSGTDNSAGGSTDAGSDGTSGGQTGSNGGSQQGGTDSGQQTGSGTDSQSGDDGSGTGIHIQPDGSGTEPTGDGDDGSGSSGGQDDTTGGVEVPAQKRFVVYDDTYFQNKPDLSAYGIEKFFITGNGFFWKADQPGGGYDMNTPNEKATRNVARRVSELGQILIIDIEHWPIDIRISSPTEVQTAIKKMIQIVDWIRDERPDVKLGFYGVGPLRDYWTPVQYWQALDNPDDRWWRQHLPLFEAQYSKWQAANDFLKPLMDKVDYIVPSLYTFYDNPQGWKYYAKGNIEEAKRYGKPVLPFIWMDFHNSTPLIGQRIGAEFWRLQLETLRELADGVVIWGGMGYSRNSQPVAQTWNEQDPWWVVTKSFMEELSGH